MAVDCTNGEAELHEGYVPVPGARLYFRDVRNERPPLVILHGGPDFNHHYLLPELDRLASAFRLIYYDQRGRGKSSEGVDAGAVGMASEIDDLDRVRRHFGFDTFALLGHSWGGLLAMEYVTSHADRVSLLILLNTAPASHADFLHLREQRETAERATLARMREIATMPGYVDGDIETEAEYYSLHFGGTFLRSDQLDRVVRRLRTHFSRADILKARAIEDRLYEQTWASPRYDLLARLRELRVPTLVIHGDRDLIPLQCARNIAEAIAESKLVVLCDCGHFAYLERPEEMLDAIARSSAPHRSS